MIISNSNNTSYSDVYEAILSFNETYYNFSEEQIKYSHYLSLNIKSSDFLIQEEGKIKSFFSGLIDKIKNLIKRFLEWIENTLNNFKASFMSNKKLKENKGLIEKALNDPNFKPEEYKLRVKFLNPEKIFLEMYNNDMKKLSESMDRSKKIIDWLKSGAKEDMEVPGVNFERDDTAEILKKHKKNVSNVALVNYNDNSLHPLNKIYLNYRKEEIIDYIDGNSKLNKEMIKNLKDTKSNLSYIIKEIDKFQAKASYIYTLKQNDEMRKLSNSLKFISFDLNTYLNACVGYINGIKELNNQHRMLAVFLINYGLGKLKKTNTSDKNEK